jgi:glycerol-3-phosphate dehydrogenase (NAD(P)+)
VGVELGKGRKLGDIIASMHMAAEGVKGAPALMASADRYGISMPTGCDVCDAIQGPRAPNEILRGLLRTAAGAESDAG